MQLQRRMRALEKRLGERLKDDGTGKLVIQPAEGSTAILADLVDFWPPTPTSSTPEWARDDVVPRTVPLPAPSSPLRSDASWSKGKGVLRMEASNGKAAEELKICVGRQTQVSQTTIMTDAVPLNRQNSSRSKQQAVLARNGDQSVDLGKIDYPISEEVEIMAQTRRRQLVKVSKIAP